MVAENNDDLSAAHIVDVWSGATDCPDEAERKPGADPAKKSRSARSPRRPLNSHVDGAAVDGLYEALGQDPGAASSEAARADNCDVTHIAPPPPQRRQPQALLQSRASKAVSYTHLTLPTNREV